jgi:predicted negative regulator of RcsB-dependent stress response
MAVYDLEEQEKIDAIKAWWQRYGGAVTVGVVLGALLLGGLGFWRHQQRTQAAQAGDLYYALQKNLAKTEPAKIVTAAREIADKFPSTAYAARAALVAAKAAFDAGDTEGARAQLQWVIDRSKEVELKALARYRLAGVLADQKKYNEAVALLDGIDNPAFATLALDLKGDILVAQGRPADARNAYKQAIEKADKNENLHNLTQFKLDALGAQQ